MMSQHAFKRVMTQSTRRAATMVNKSSSGATRTFGAASTAYRRRAVTDIGRQYRQLQQQQQNQNQAANMATATLNKPTPPTLPNPFRRGGGFGFGFGNGGGRNFFNRLSTNTKRNLAIGLGITGLLQYQYGHTDDIFFEHKFTTTNVAEPENDLADFYGTEDIMEIFCVLPFMMNLMMRQATFDDEGNIHAWGLMGPGELEVSVVFSDESDDEESDESEEGEEDIPEKNKKSLPWFNKRETFKDVAPSWLGGFTLWEMTINFGYHQIGYDEKTGNPLCEITHNGEKFHGLFPIRFIFNLHSKYVIWATQRYINSKEFGNNSSSSDNDDDDDLVDDILQQQRHNMSLYAFKEYINGLTEEIQRIQKDDEGSSIEKKHQLDVTLQRLKTISVNIERKKTTLRMRRTKPPSTSGKKTTIEGGTEASAPAAATVPAAAESTIPFEQDSEDTTTIIPKIRTIQRHNTVVRKDGENSEKIQLIVDDKEMRDTLQTAMKQIQDAQDAATNNNKASGDPTASPLGATAQKQQQREEEQQQRKPEVKPSFIVRRQTQ